MRRIIFPCRESLFILFILAAAFGGLSLTGCSYWEGTKDASQYVYKGYINPDPSVDLRYKGLSGKGDQKLASLFVPVDRQLDEILMVLGNQDDFPSQSWIDSFLRRFPWMTGVAVVAMDGTVLAQQPEVSLKPLDFTPLAKFSDDLVKRRIRAFLESTELGPEMCVAAPFFKDNALVGAVVAHFDPRTLAAYSPKPEELYILSPQGPLWTDGESPDQELLRTDWTRLFKGAVRGTVKTEHGKYLWIVRIFGGDPIVYATKAEEGGSRFWPW